VATVPTHPVEFLARAVEEEAAIRRRQRLQPAGGSGDKIFPPTYPGDGLNAPPRHVFERRRIDGQDVWCVLVDSVQSQANRLEESLLRLVRQGELAIPHVVVDFRAAGLVGISEVTSLDAPHRVYDAILRDSLYGGQPFMESDLGRELAQARAEDASAVLCASPTALLFGAWHSTGAGGGLGAKFARCLVSEIVAVNVPVEERPRSGEVQTSARRTGSRIDPLGVLKDVEVYRGEAGWGVTKADAGKGAKQVRPSEINHGNIAPTVTALGVTCDYLEHVFVLSFAGLRRLHFGSQERDRAARMLLASLGLLAVAEQDSQGYALRSRCDLVCDGSSPMELVHPDGTVTEFHLDAKEARNAYTTAFAAAQEAGLALPTEPIRLTPQDKLVQIVRKSQQLALSGKGGEADGE